EAERRALDSELADLRTSLERIAAERAETARAMTPAVLAVYELVQSRRAGVGVAEARDGICTICHVRLRPQVFNTILRNEQIVQCDSCNRILYYVPKKTAPAASESVTQPQ